MPSVSVRLSLLLVSVKSWTVLLLPMLSSVLISRISVFSALLVLLLFPGLLVLQSILMNRPGLCLHQSPNRFQWLTLSSVLCFSSSISLALTSANVSFFRDGANCLLYVYEGMQITCYSVDAWYLCVCKCCMMWLIAAAILLIYRKWNRAMLKL